MGRKWANIKEKKAAKDANNSRVYAKFGIEIYVAAKSGDPDPHANQKLRFVIERAKTYNVPKHIIDRAIEKAKGSADEILEYLMEKDIDVRDVVEEDGQIIVYTEPEDFHHAQEALKEKGIEEFTVTELEMVPQNEVTLEGDDLANFEKMLDVLEDLEDVQKVHHNVDLPE